LSDASALAVTGAMRCDGISTPVQSLIFEVCTAAAANATKTSAFRSGVSKNQAYVKPICSARFTTCQ